MIIHMHVFHPIYPEGIRMLVVVGPDALGRGVCSPNLARSTTGVQTPGLARVSLPSFKGKGSLPIFDVCVTHDKLQAVRGIRGIGRRMLQEPAGTGIITKCGVIGTVLNVVARTKRSLLM